jgi:hypothetical protein
MARALLQHVVMDADGDVQASKAVTFFEDDGVTPYAASIYDVPSGGVPVLVHTTTSEGLIRRYVDPADARRAKLTVAGAATQSQFDLDPATVTTLTGTQTLTNKTLTSPTITTPTITGGTLAAPALTDPTVTGTLLGGKLLDKGGNEINVKAFETLSDTVGVNGQGEYDSLALEAAIALAKSLSVTQYGLFGEGRLTTITLPPGRYNLARPLDLDGLVGIRFVGAGYEATTFGIATSGSGIDSVATWSTQSMISMVGSNFCRLEGFSVTPSNGVAAPIPECGLLIATNAAFTNWLGTSESANVSNRLEVFSVRVRGAFSKAAHVSFANVSSIYQSCEFSRDKSLNVTYPNGTTINQACLVLTRDNAIGVTQCGSVSFLSVALGTTSNSDLTFLDCEAHDLCQGAPTATSCTCPAVWIEEGYDVTFLGGNWSSSARGASPVDSAPSCGYLRLSMGTSAGGALTGPRNILIENVHWLSEFGDLPDMGLRLTSNAANDARVLRSRVEHYPTNDTDEINGGTGPAIIASDVVIRNCRINIQEDSGAAVINGGRAAVGGSTVANFLRWTIENVNVMDENVHLNQANMIVFGGSEAGLFTDCKIDFQGMPIIGNGSTWVRGVPRRLGTIAGFTFTHGDAAICGGGATSLAAAATAYYGFGSADATEANVVPVTVPQACTALNLHVRVSAAPDAGGGTQTLTYTLRKASPATGFSFNDTALTGTITETSVVGADTVGAHAVSLAKGDVLTLKIVAGAGTTTNAWATWALSCIAEGV